MLPQRPSRRPRPDSRNPSCPRGKSPCSGAPGAFLVNCVLTWGSIADMTCLMLPMRNNSPKSSRLVVAGSTALWAVFYWGLMGLLRRRMSASGRQALGTVSKPAGQPHRLQTYPSPAPLRFENVVVDFDRRRWDLSIPQRLRSWWGARVFFLTDSESRDENNHRAAEFRSIRKDGDEPWANA